MTRASDDQPALSEWARTLQRRLRQRGINAFILHGPGVRDIHPLGARRNGTIGEFLAEVIFADRGARRAEGTVMRLIALLLPVLVLGCHPREDPEMAAPAEQADDHTTAAAEHAMAGPMPADPHLRLSALRAPAPGDSARAAAILAVMRRDLSRSRDIRVAQADGFRQFIPGGAAPVQHFTKLRWAFQSRRELNPSHPTSLLYRRAADSTLELVGAMFTAPASMSEDELDARLPLSVARWHQHINWCVPPLADARRRWRARRKTAIPCSGRSRRLQRRRRAKRWAGVSARGCWAGWYT